MMAMQDPMESRILRQLKAGREEGYKYLFDHHYQVLCVIASRYVHDDFLAETIVGDVIFHLWEKRGTLEISTSLRSYLVQSVRNRCLDYLKSRPVRTEMPTGLEEDFPVISYAKGSDYPLGRLLEKELEGEIAKSIDHLPDQSRKVFRMSRFENKKYGQIASELGISTDTVKYHVKRALALLRADLGKYLSLATLFLLGQMMH